MSTVLLISCIIITIKFLSFKVLTDSNLLFLILYDAKSSKLKQFNVILYFLPNFPKEFIFIVLD